MAIRPENTIPGHLIEPGKLSEIQELTKVAKMVMTLICSNISSNHHLL
jgi:hypothetical protein